MLDETSWDVTYEAAGFSCLTIPRFLLTTVTSGSGGDDKITMYERVLPNDEVGDDGK